MHPCINTYTWLLSFILHNMQDTHKLLGSWVSWIEWYSTLALYMITLCSLHNTSNTSWDIRSFFFHYASSQCSLLNFSYHARFSWSIPKPSLNKPSSVSRETHRRSEAQQLTTLRIRTREDCNTGGSRSVYTAKDDTSHCFSYVHKNIEHTLAINFMYTLACIYVRITLQTTTHARLKSSCTHTRQHP